jgi:hypothetical protein
VCGRYLPIISILTIGNLIAVSIPATNNATLKIWKLLPVLDHRKTSNSALAVKPLFRISPKGILAKILSLYATKLARKHFHVVTSVNHPVILEAVHHVNALYPQNVAAAKPRSTSNVPKSIKKNVSAKGCARP